MNRKFFNKHGSMITNLSRDIMTLGVGDRLPTIIEYTTKFSLSRGVVQSAISLLEDEGCFSLNRSGKLGTVLTEINYEKLSRHTLWDPVVGTMPIPFNDIFRSLATALYYDSRNLPLDSSIAYVSGARNRWSMLSKGFFDYIVTSVATAEHIVAADDDIELLFTLPQCRYAEPYCLIFMNNQDTEIRDGMKVGVDPDAIDQTQLSQAMCAGRDVEFIKMPIEGTLDILYHRSVDCMIVRNEKWFKNNTDLVPLPIDTTAYPIADTMIPAILVNKNNYGIKKLLGKYLSPKDIALAQNHALSVQTNYRF